MASMRPGIKHAHACAREVHGKCFRFAYVGLKGDWPYLRKWMKLETGFTSRRVCHHCAKPDTWRQVGKLLRAQFAEDWWRFGREGCLHGWEPGADPLPWKAQRSIFRGVVGADTHERIRTDLAHTWSIGVGKEFLGSCLLALCDMRLVNGRSLDAQLDALYMHFRAWCARSGESCKINEFSKKQLKINAKLGLLCAWLL